MTADTFYVTYLPSMCMITTVAVLSARCALLPKKWLGFESNCCV